MWENKIDKTNFYITKKIKKKKLKIWLKILSPNFYSAQKSKKILSNSPGKHVTKLF